ncbi:MAG: site-specific DNA-methyltransferase [Euryarchaeota archaeon]|nr:site-specific DNA-methyltransferase [Euryarchaeota archaeon]
MKAKEEEFIKSCRPLNEMLDSVRNVEGFPIGKDEDILALSEAPWYTACPNPYVNEFIKAFGTPYDEETDDYERKPYIGDVSEGKKDPIYNAHSYHTKVPYKAIMKFIEHYTDEGDVVFDGFCGTGMTGVAAQILNRSAILSDLSSIATFIAYNLNEYTNLNKFDKEVERVLQEVNDECGWLYETTHIDGTTKGEIVYTIFSEVLICPYCGNEYVVWDAAVDYENNIENILFDCPTCKAKINKSESEQAHYTFFDEITSTNVTQVKRVPVLINYSIKNKRFLKKPDKLDLIEPQANLTLLLEILK